MEKTFKDFIDFINSEYCNIVEIGRIHISLIDQKVKRELAEWAKNSTPGEDRDIACSRIYRAYITRSPDIDLSRLGLTCLPDIIGCLKELWRVNLSYNRLRQLPKSFWNLYRIRVLWLINNPINHIENVEKLYSLKQLYIQKTNITSFPKSFSFKKFIKNMQILSVPVEFGNTSKP